MSHSSSDSTKDSGFQPQVTVEPDLASENVAEVEETEELDAERREREARSAPDLPDRAFERITPQV